jgi:predicted transcriptional regulator
MGTRISIQEIRIWRTLSASVEGLTAMEISARAKVSQITARQRTRRLVAQGLVERVEVFPARYRVSDKHDERNAYTKTIETAAEVFGETAAHN